ncbi:DEAD/DEAH box helicase [Xanthomonas codiaei]|uniref:DNA 3'-5' helicase II n=2 Tax=Xanthomonas TaxID=338 RepID=A0A2S7C5Q5_9XANT|nr:ATP-binding domain-containing protein [Xanthomonas codiaei]PPU56884.1 hypothetical protein XcodCFBP4690_21205 [Xanthomonas codiaei]
MVENFGVLAGSLALENKPFHMQILSDIKREHANLHGYVAYKLTRLGRVSDDDVPSFLVVTKERGILLLDVVEERIIAAHEREGVDYWRADSGGTFIAKNLVMELYSDEIISRLKNDLRLYDRKTRRLRVPVESKVVFCRNSEDEVDGWYEKFANYEAGYVTVENLRSWLNELPCDAALSENEYASICSLLEGTFVYQRRSEGIDERPLRTRNDFIQRSLRVIFKQDEAQRVASMQLPPGPQRIRGLAGTGKTIVLSLKAAITHAKFEDFKILYLFNTQSMYQQVQSLIAQHYTMQAKKAPDFSDQMHVLHAWGGRQRPGLYSTICDRIGMRPLTWAEVRHTQDSLAFIYNDLLKRAGHALEPIYDLVLIDEAQDFPDEVFQVVYKLTKGVGQDKRIIWAYDEFQSLRDAQMREPAEMFGVDENGQPNIPNTALKGYYPGEIQKDFVLPNCYRTPRPVLMAAHGVAMGLYTSNPNEMFYTRGDWEALGYSVISPNSLFIEEGEQVELERGDENSKNILEGLLRAEGADPLKLIKIRQLESDAEQLEYVASQVRRLLDYHEVPAEEIVIVNLKQGNNKESMLEMQKYLTRHAVPSVIPGYVESADIFKPKGSVTITTPFRAKGNEANIIFVINAENVSLDRTLRTRNAFFVALTRSRGWCYISGVGAGVSLLSDEIERIKADLPKFRFICPSKTAVRKKKSLLSLSDQQAADYQKIADMLRKNPELANVFKEDFFDESNGDA